MLELRDIAYTYANAERPAVQHMSLHVSQGELVCLLGDNGSGKSTVGRIAAGDLPIQEGSVLVEGEPLPSDQGGILVGMVRQEPHEQLVAPLVGDEVRFGPRCHLMSEPEVEECAQEALDLCGIADLARSRTMRLSGGEQQLVALAGALAVHPRYLVLDEVCAHLDEQSRRAVRDAIAALCRSGVGVLMITHLPDDLAEAQRVIVLDEGTVVWEGAPDEWEAWSQDHAGHGGSASADDIGELSFVAPEHPRSLALEDVTVAFEERTVLDHLSLHVSPGELTLLCGPSGSGKTTAARILAGVAKPDEGRALLGTDEVRAGQVGLAFQQADDQLFSPTVWDDVAYGPRNGGLEGDELTYRVDMTLTAFGVPREFWHSHAHTLSGGMRHRVALASIIAQAPAAYIFDEPSAGLDATGRQLLHAVVARLTAAGAPVLLITHDVHEWEREAAQVVRVERSAKQQAGEGLAGQQGSPRRADAPAESTLRLAKIDARVWLLGVVALTVGLFTCRSHIGLAATALFVILMLGVVRVKPRRVIRMLLPAVPMLTFVLLGHTLRLDGTGDVALFGSVRMNLEGLETGVAVILRIVTTVGLFVVFAEVFSTVDTLQVCSALLAPFAHFGVPVADASLVLSVTLCLISQVFDTFERIEKAQRARGAHLDDGSVVSRLRAWAAVMTPLVVVMFAQADTLAQTLQARGYQGDMTLPRHRLELRDWATMVLVLAAAALLVMH